MCVRVCLRAKTIDFLRTTSLSKMVRITIDLQEEERLSEEVKLYSCLYDKADKGHKEKDRVINAWKAIEGALGFEEGWLFLLNLFNFLTVRCKNKFAAFSMELKCYHY